MVREVDDVDGDVWRLWLELSSQIPAALNRQLVRESELTLQDYDVLVQLAAAPGRRLRVAALADAVHWERSRLSHHVGRMVARGLVERESCENDARGTVVALTRSGASALRRAADGHRRAVADVFVEPLSPTERASLRSILVRLRDALDAASRN